jgi:hypothetical protein
MVRNIIALFHLKPLFLGGIRTRVFLSLGGRDVHFSRAQIKWLFPTVTELANNSSFAAKFIYHLLVSYGSSRSCPYKILLS